MYGMRNPVRRQKSTLRRNDYIFIFPILDSTMNIGPQFTVTAGIQENPSAKHIGSWTGLTIKEILEKVDLSNIIIDDDDKKVSFSQQTHNGLIVPPTKFLSIISINICMYICISNEKFLIIL